MTAGTSGALFGGVGEVRLMLPCGDLVGGHLRDQTGVLGPRGYGKEK